MQEKYNKLLDYTGKTVLVTGAAQGIGRGIAEVFAAQGAKVLIADINVQMAQAAAADLCGKGQQARALSVDLTDCGAIQVLFEKMPELDVLVHNAGCYPLCPLAEINPQVLERTMSINLLSLFWLVKAALPLFMRRGGGNILVTSSVTGPRVAYPGLTHYAASKAGVNGFIRSAALELAPHNIRVNGVEPGMVRTPGLGGLGDQDLSASMAQDGGIPLRRLGEPEDIAYAMLFLGSDEASYITGQTIIIDGGSTLPETTAVNQSH